MEFAAIVLAAGAGSRFGGGKMTAPLKGRPLVLHALAAADAAPVRAIVVVLGAEHEQVEQAIAEFRSRVPVITLLAPDWQEGVAASLKAGVAALPATCAGAFIFLGDMPDIPSSIFGSLADALRSGAAAAAPACRGQRGHPVLLGKNLLNRVHTLHGDQGARSLLADRALVPVEDEGVLRDIDTRHDM